MAEHLPQKYRLKIAYDGTAYGGWQVQDNAVSIQSLLEKALSTVLRAPTPIVGSGRTDAGVHALGQVAHFTSEKGINCERLLFSLAALLPPDIRAWACEPVGQEFHARYSAVSKEYHYHLHLDRVRDPFKRLYSMHVFTPVDRELLREAARLFVGERDFTSFANEAREGSAAKDAVRTLYRLECLEEEGGVRLEFEGNGFLYKMVRNIVGTLLGVAGGKIPTEEIPKIFAAKDRRRAGEAAPPQGLFLVRVGYRE